MENETKKTYSRIELDVIENEFYMLTKAISSLDARLAAGNDLDMQQWNYVKSLIELIDGEIVTTEIGAQS